ncbi:hypothetical protein BD626DRAFT_502548 [Schizophyllum amplum]|uniref:F-box domain-containing protein n=1 Tax=Schizophyllum amplum TaxID=97359 RepID=A0A550C8M9_9AGAR|nr:hypothetical protein BD626DRAFT_502548 [Auriculariopsis ampla]
MSTTGPQESATCLPQELLELVLEQLHASGDAASLKNTAMAHSSLLETSQKYIFNEVQLSEINTHSVFSATKTLVRKLSDILEESSHLGDYVRVLRIEESWDYSSSLTWYSWIYEDGALPKVLFRLPNLQELSFQPHYVLSYSGMTPHLRGALEQACTLSTLVTLSMFNLRGLPMAVLQQLPQSLRHLRLWDVTLVHGGERTQAADGARLEHLALKLQQDDFARLAARLLEPDSSVRVEGLQNLTITAETPHCHQTMKMLLAAAGTVYKRWNFGHVSRSGHDSQDVQLTEMSSLRLLALAGLHLEQEISPFHWLLYVLQSATHVEQFQLHFVAEIWDIDACWYWTSAWNLLDMFLTSRMKNIVSVSIFLDVKGYTRQDTERPAYIVDDVKGFLPRLCAGGRVSVETKQLHDEDLLLRVDSLTKYQHSP